MQKDFEHPLATTHQGKAIFFVSVPGEDGAGDSIFYNVLDSSPDAKAGDDDWQGYRELEVPGEITGAGLNLVSVARRPGCSGLFRVVSDQKYLYLFRASHNAIYLNRYTLIQASGDGKAAGDAAVYELKPAWQVRFRRSGDVNLPAGDRDSQSFLDLANDPFFEPVFELPIATDEAFALQSLGFSVLLTPTNAGGLRWQFLLINQAENRLYVYSFERGSTGLPVVSTRQLDDTGDRIVPDLRCALSRNGTTLKFVGPPDALVYMKQEPVSTDDGQFLQVKQTAHVLLTAQVEAEAPGVANAQSGGTLSMATLDFAVSGEGRLAFTGESGGNESAFDAGEVLPATSALHFDGIGFARMKGVGLSSRPFTLQAWVYSTATGLESRGILGGADGGGSPAMAPALWVENQQLVCIGFGDGDTSHVVRSRDNVLPLRRWTQLTAQFNGNTFRLYVNGTEVALTGAVEPGASPGEGRLDRIGDDGAHRFVGDIDEVRIWSRALTEEEIHEYLFREIPQQVAEGDADLLGYWRLDDGHGVVARDLSANRGDAELVGAAWQSAHAPILRESDAINYFDSRGMTLRVGLVAPSGQWPAYGALKRGSRPSLLSGGDGLIHLYYQGADDRFYAMQRDSAEARAVFTAPWTAAASAPADTQTGSVFLAARQVGSQYNHAYIALRSNATSALLADVTLANQKPLAAEREASPPGGEERWSGVPRHIDQFLAVLQGKTTSQPGDAGLRDGTRVFFDHSGTRNVAVRSMGDAGRHGFLQAISSQIGAFAVTAIDAVAAGDGHLDVKVSFASDSRHPEETLTATFKHVPVAPDRFLSTLFGSDPDYEYAWAANAVAGSTHLFALPAAGGTRHLEIFLPDADVQGATFTIRQAGAADRCTVTITVSRDSGDVSAEWSDVPRQAGPFMRHIIASTEPAQEEVAGLLRFRNTAGEQTLDTGTVDVDAPLQVISGLFVVLDYGIGGEVEPFSVALEPLQSATATREASDLSLGSNLFAAQVHRMPSNGYLGIVGIGTTEDSVLLAAPGTDGGWQSLPPAFAVATDGGAHLEVAADGDTIDRLDLTAGSTLEAWARTDLPERSESGGEFAYPRLVHANLVSSGSGSRYFLGLSSTNTLQFHKSPIGIDDKLVPEEQAEERLFSGDQYTVQCYVYPDIDSADDPGRVYEKRAADLDSPSEVLRLVQQGPRPYTSARLQLTVTPAAGEPVVIESADAIPTLAWSCVTVVRSGDRIRIYIDGALDIEREGIPSTWSAHSQLLVGDNGADLFMGMELNQFCIWSRALGPDQVARRVYRSFGSTDDGLVLQWPLDDSSVGPRAVNTASATSGLYNTEFDRKEFFWDSPGVFYRAIAGFRDSAAITRQARIAPTHWNHLAAVYQPGFAIDLDDGQFASCGNDSSLNMAQGFTIACWVTQRRRSGNTAQTIFSKFGVDAEQQSYEFGINATGAPFLRIRLQGSGGGEALPEGFDLQSFVSSKTVVVDLACQLTATVRIWSVLDEAVAGGGAKQCYAAGAQIYLDGSPSIEGPEGAELLPVAEDTFLLSVVGGSGSGRYKAGETVPVTATDLTGFTRWYGQTGGLVDRSSASTSFKMPAEDRVILARGTFEAVTLRSTSVDAQIGRSQPLPDGGGSNHFSGLVSHIRLWNVSISAGQAAELAGANEDAAGAQERDEGLVSEWRFQEQAGRVAHDSRADNDAVLSNSTLWCPYYGTASLAISINGEVVPVRPVHSGAVGGYGHRQYRLGAMVNDNGRLLSDFQGSLDEVRVWTGVRTPQQIADNMNRYLTGSERDLVGYWRFDVGSGKYVFDQSAGGNNAKFAASASGTMPQWMPSTAPISNEAPPVINALGGQTLPASASIRSGPTAVEYGVMQYDAAGSPISVLKRSYIYRSAEDGSILAYTGYKVGNLRQVYIGQVQTQPTLLGYIEGAPPLPSENLTRPFYLDPTKPSYLSYYNSSSVTLSETEGESIGFVSSREDGSHLNFSFGAGISPGSKVETIIGVPPVQSVIQQVKVSGKFAAGTAIDWSTKANESTGVGTSFTRGTTNHFYNCGDWERPDDSGAYFLRSGERRFIPNNEGYALVRSSTADMYSLHHEETGALVAITILPNPDIPEDTNLIYFPISPTYQKNGSLDGRIGLQADPETEQSYFRPSEAYTLKKRIEKQNLEMASYYTGFDATARGRSQNRDLSEASGQLFHDWESRAPRRSIANTYVWTAAGGLYSEQSGYASLFQETHSGAYQFSWSLGFSGELSLSFISIGPYFQSSLFGGTNWTVTVQKARDQSHALKLDAAADPDGFLQRYLGVESPCFDPAPEPGKVDSYRFMSFYLSPEEKNSRTFFDEVIDQEWLNNSSDPRAAALREAEGRSRSNPSWRVLHRVTFVSRIPPAFQPGPVLSEKPMLPEPSNMTQNTVFISLVTSALAHRVDPSPAEIGQAVRLVVFERLGSYLPWWSGFLEAAEVPNSDASRTLAAIIDDAMKYMSQYFQTVPPKARMMVE